MIISTSSYYNFLRLFWNQISRKHKFNLLGLLTLMIFTSLGEALSIGAIVPFLFVLTNPESLLKYHNIEVIYNYFNFNNPNQIILPFTIFFIILIIFSAILRFFTLYFQTKSSFNIGKEYCIKIYENVLQQSYSTHVSRNSSEIISAISIKANNVIFSILMPILVIVNAFFLIILMIVALSLINPNVTFISIICFTLIYYIISLLVKNKLLKDSKTISVESNNVIKSLQEGLGSIRDVILDGSYKNFVNYYKYSDSKLKNAQCRTLIIGGSPRFIIETIGIISISLLAFYLTLSKNGFDQSIPTLGALALAAQRVLPVLQQAFNSWTNIKSNKESLVDTINLINYPKLTNKITESHINKFNKYIKFINVTFSYPNSSNNIFKELNLTIFKNEKVGIIGVQSIAQVVKELKVLDDSPPNPKKRLRCPLDGEFKIGDSWKMTH